MPSRPRAGSASPTSISLRDATMTDDLLTNPTPEDLRRRAAWAQTNANAARFCGIPAEPFTLTGSDRPRDVGAVAG